MKQPTRKPPPSLRRLHEILPDGYQIRTYLPRAGSRTRYRFFREAPANQTYFGPAEGIFTALTFREARAFALGLNG
jgi:hypothetical protein